MMAEAQTQPNNSSSNNDTTIPLRRWIEGEEASVRLIAGFGEVNHKYALLLRKITIAYGITELLRHVRSYPSQAELSPASLEEQFSIDNFVVRISGETSSGTTILPSSTPDWNDIKGVDMISPPLSVNIYEPSFLMSGFYDSGGAGNQGENMGRYLEVEFFPDRSGGNNNNNNMIATSRVEEDARCHLLGILQYELFSHLSIERTNATKSPEDGEEGPPNKKKKSSPDVTDFPPSAQHIIGNTTYIPMNDLGFPQPICILVQNLLDCGEYVRPVNAYESLDVVIKDLHLLLLDPTRFLFEHEPTSENGTIDLMFREHTLYGREKELTLITDAFCRVSTGRSEAFFIEGYSGKWVDFVLFGFFFHHHLRKLTSILLCLYVGSGKSRLVNSLTTRIDICEGYVITHKFDEMSKEHSLTDLISLFNDLCSLIHQKSSRQFLLLTANALIQEFGTDLSVLAYLLPNVKALAPQLQNEEQEESMDQMNLQSVCFILQRFLRVVSSKNHPVMLFLDDLQWCDSAPLKVIEAILCDPFGESCLFFVGCYRSNEVKPDHPVFPLMRSLRSFNVPATLLSLKGLNPNDLNTLISDALCMFPRMTKPLSDIVFHKTKGNVRLKVFPSLLITQCLTSTH